MPKDFDKKVTPGDLKGAAEQITKLDLNCLNCFSNIETGTETRTGTGSGFDSDSDLQQKGMELAPVDGSGFASEII